MKQWMRRVRGVLGMGAAWAVGGLGVAAIIEGADNVTPGGIQAIHVVDMWPPVLLVAGFLGGLVFGTLLGVVGARRRFEELSLGRFTALGAATGAVLAGLVIATGGPAFAVGVMLVSGTVGGAASLVVARIAERRGLFRPDDATRLAAGEERDALHAPADHPAGIGAPADHAAGIGARSRHPEGARRATEGSP